MAHLLLSELLAAKWGKWGKAGQPHFCRPNCLRLNKLRKWGSVRAGKGGQKGDYLLSPAFDGSQHVAR